MSIILTKTFHHNNLTLQLIHHIDFNIYSINILQHNTNQNYNLFGIFTNLSDAETKFHSIKL